MGFRWSYSKWSCYKECLRKYKHKYIDRLPDPSGPAAERGTRIHSLAEELVKGNIQGIPNELKKFNRHFKALMKCPTHTEQSLCIDRDWHAVDPTQDKEKIWLLAKIDVTAFHPDQVMTVVDYKTGKVYPTHEEQAEVYAAVVAGNYETSLIDTEMWYIDSGLVKTWSYDDDTVWDDLVPKWTERGLQMESTKKYPLGKEPNCHWCNFHRSKGGPCKGKD